MLRNEKVEMADQIKEMDALKDQVTRLNMVENENKMLRLVFRSDSLIASTYQQQFENLAKGEKRKVFKTKQKMDQD